MLRTEWWRLDISAAITLRTAGRLLASTCSYFFRCRCRCGANTILCHASKLITLQNKSLLTTRLSLPQYFTVSLEASAELRVLSATAAYASCLHAIYSGRPQLMMMLLTHGNTLTFSIIFRLMRHFYFEYTISARAGLTPR